MDKASVKRISNLRDKYNCNSSKRISPMKIQNTIKNEEKRKVDGNKDK